MLGGVKMSYIIKKDKAKEIKNKFRNLYIAETLGKNPSSVSLILNGKLRIPKTTAYAFAKVIDKDLEIDDLFERV